MPIIGSYSDNPAFAESRIKMMNRATVDESLDKLQEIVRELTPVGETGDLKESIERSDVDRVASKMWRGEVYSTLEYAASIEYGWSDRNIRPTTKGWLKWEENGQKYFAKSVTTDYEGAHMFQRGKEIFERLHSEAIARGNAAQWLGASGAVKRTPGTNIVRDTATGRFV